MGDERPQSREIADDRIRLEGQADVVAEEPAAPPVVVPPHEGHGKATIDEFGQSPEGSCVSTWNDRAVLEPEVEEISVEDQFGRVIGGIG